MLQWGVRLKSEVDLDELDRQLVTALEIDPRMSYAALGERLGVAGMTVRTRLSRLRESGALEVTARPNPGRFGLTQILGLIQAELPAVEQELEILAGSRFVTRVDRLVGEFDVSFMAVFPTHHELGSLVHRLQQPGVRRLVIQHIMATPTNAAGWDAVFASPAREAPPKTSVAAGVVVPKSLERDFHAALCWLDAYGAADLARLSQLCAPDFVFTIKRPNAIAGDFTGLEALDDLLQRKVAAYEVLENEVVRFADCPGSHYEFTIDVLGTVERRNGVVRNQFGRFAFQLREGRICEVSSLAEMHLPDVVAEDLPD